MANGGHQMDHFIRDAIHKVATEPEDATDREFSLAIAGYLAHKIEESRWSIKKLAVPAVGGGGLLAGIIEGLRIFLGGM